MKHLPHHLPHVAVPLRHRVIISVVIIGGSFAIYMLTKSEGAKLAAELAIAPHIDRLIYGLV